MTDPRSNKQLIQRVNELESLTLRAKLRELGLLLASMPKNYEDGLTFEARTCKWTAAIGCADTACGHHSTMYPSPAFCYWCGGRVE